MTNEMACPMIAAALGGIIVAYIINRLLDKIMGRKG